MRKSIFKLPSFWLVSIVFLALLLRLSFLDQIPPALYSDEVSQGFNAYSLLKTGRDEYGTAWPVSIRSFGDWKPPLQTYLMIPTIALFGLNAWGVRLPGALLGTATVIVLYFLVQDLLNSFTENKQPRKNRLTGLVCTLMLAISPWHILQSRSGLHGAITLFFVALGFWMLFKGLRNTQYWWISAISFPLSIYGYHGTHLILLFSLGYFVFFRFDIFKFWKRILPMLAVSLLILSPFVISFMQNPDVLLGRARFISVFYDRGVDLTIWQEITSDGLKTPPLLARFFHNKLYHYATDITRRILQHLSGKFLFLQGDTHLPFQIPGMGILYYFEIVLLGVGVWFLFNKNKRQLIFLGGLWIIFLIPSSFTFITPAANRSFYAILPEIIISSVGLIHVITLIKIRLVKHALLLVIAINVGYFVWQFYAVLPKYYAQWWLFGYKEVYAYLETNTDSSTPVYFTGQASVPYIYYLFFRKIDPTHALNNLIRNEEKDEAGFAHVSQIDNYTFVRKKDWENGNFTLFPYSYVVTLGKERFQGNEVKQIFYPDGNTAFRIYRL